MGGEIVGRRPAEPAEEKQRQLIIAGDLDFLRHPGALRRLAPPFPSHRHDEMGLVGKRPTHDRQAPVAGPGLPGVIGRHGWGDDHWLRTDRVPGGDVDAVLGRVVGEVGRHHQPQRRGGMMRLPVALRLREEDIADRRMTPMNDRAATLEDLAGQKRHEVADPLRILGLRPGRHSPGKPDPHSGEG